MKKYIFTFLSITSVLFISAAFDFSKYKQSSLDEIVNIINTQLIENKKYNYDKGLELFKYTLSIDFIFDKYPTDTNSDDSKGDMNLYCTFMGLDYEMINNLFSKKYILKYKDINFTFFFQKQLIPNIQDYINKGYLKLGDKIKLYIMFGSYNSFSNDAKIYINNYSFNSRS